jgi:hypothetical protein
MALSFDEAQHRLLLHGRKGRLRIAWRTYLVDRLDHVAVEYTGEEIVRIHRDGTYQLFAGRRRTPAVKDRIQKYSPARILDRGQGPDPRGWTVHGEHFIGYQPFEDGIRVDGKGNPVFVPDRKKAFLPASLHGVKLHVLIRPKYMDRRVPPWFQLSLHGDRLVAALRVGVLRRSAYPRLALRAAATYSDHRGGHYSGTVGNYRQESRPGPTKFTREHPEDAGQIQALLQKVDNAYRTLQQRALADRVSATGEDGQGVWQHPAGEGQVHEEAVVPLPYEADGAEVPADGRHQVRLLGQR